MIKTKGRDKMKKILAKCEASVRGIVTGLCSDTRRDKIGIFLAKGEASVRGIVTGLCSGTRRNKIDNSRQGRSFSERNFAGALLLRKET